MRYPVTFKQSDLDIIISDWIKNNYKVKVEGKKIGYDGKDPKEALNKRIEFQFSSSTWYGMIIDTLVTIQECTQVFKAQTVTMQS